MNDHTMSYCPLADKGFISVSGPEAGSFLHAQLAIDVSRLATNGARLAPWLNAKGQVTGLFSLARKADQHWVLACHGSLTAALVERLNRYVLRSPVQITDMSDAWGAAIIGGGEEGLVAARFAVSHDPDAWTEYGGMLCRQTLPGLVEAVGPAERVAALGQELPRTKELLGRWERQMISAGIPQLLTPSQRDQYTAHMLNLDVLGALSFHKGCYPGQEVVARTQNLGRTKRRTLLFRTAHAATVPGMAILDASGTNQGEILNAAVGTPTLLLAVATVAAAHGPLFLEAPDGPELELAALPYAIPELGLRAGAPHHDSGRM